MKKQLYLTCTAALFFINAPAQQLNFGAVAGTNYSFDNHVAEKFHLGYSVGAFMEVAFNRHIFARGEITYLSKQRSNLQQSVGDNKFAPYTVNAWQIPLTLGYRVKWKALQPYLQAGMFVHSAQNDRVSGPPSVVLERVRLEYIRPTVAIGTQWKRWAIELDWQIGKRVTAADFNTYNQAPANFMSIAGPCGCIYYPGCEKGYGNYTPLSVRTDALLLKTRYYFGD